MRYYLYDDQCVYSGHMDASKLEASPGSSTRDAPADPTNVGGYIRRNGEWKEFDGDRSQLGHQDLTESFGMPPLRPGEEVDFPPPVLEKKPKKG